MIVEQNSRDQKAGNDEKHVYTDVSAAGERHTGMEKHDGYHGDSTQPVDFRTILQSYFLRLFDINQRYPARADNLS